MTSKKDVHFSLQQFVYWSIKLTHTGGKVIKKLTYQILFSLLLTTALYGSTARLAPEAEPIALVHGCVNVVTGEFVQQRTDLVVEGPSPISLSRTYDSGSTQTLSTLGHGFTWSISRDLRSTGKQWTTCSLEEREGIQLTYQTLVKRSVKAPLFRIPGISPASGMILKPAGFISADVITILLQAYASG